MKGLRQQIIDAALVLFEEYGYHGISVNQIVEHAGTSKGGFYHHFKAKDELLFVIHDTFITYVLNKAQIATETYTASPTKKLQAIIKDFVKVFDLYQSHIAVFYQEHIYLHPQYEKRIKEKRDQFKQIIMDAVGEGVQKGEFRQDISIEITGMAILGMVNWSYMWYKQSGAKSIEEIGDIYIDLILHAVLHSDILERGTIEDVLIR